jgi:glucosamine-phosphate N-acetyltransferase
LQRGRIEEVVVDENERGNGLAKTLIKTLIKMSRTLGCYKLSLDAKDEVAPFYQKMGFKKESNTLNLRF